MKRTTTILAVLLAIAVIAAGVLGINLNNTNTMLAETEAALMSTGEELASTKNSLADMTTLQEQTATTLAETEAALMSTGEELASTKNSLADMTTLQEQTAKTLSETEATLTTTSEELASTKAALTEMTELKETAEAQLAAVHEKLTASAKGLLSDVTVTVTLNEDGTIATMVVDASGETQAISAPCTEEAFLSQFIGKKGPFTADVVAGATFTSNAVIEAVNSLFPEEAPAGVELTGKTRGFQSDVIVTLWVDAGVITGIKVDSSKETKGFGTRCGEDEAFLSQFIDKTAPVTVDVLAGATVTSNAVIEAVNSLFPDEAATPAEEATVPVVWSAKELQALTYDELVALKDKINLAIWNSQEWREVEVPQGVWVVGEDIPAGKWTIKSASGMSTRVCWGETLDASGVSISYDSRISEDAALYSVDYWAYERSRTIEVTWDLKEGQYIIVASGIAVFTPYAGKPSLGFK